MKTVSDQVAFSFALFVIILTFFLAAGCVGKTTSGFTGKSRTVVQGQVVDRNGRPVSQSAVQIKAVDSTGVSSVGFTDFSGTFQFFDLPAGKYRVNLLESPETQAKVIELNGNAVEEVGLISLQREVKVELNKEAAPYINPEAAKSINPDAAETLNPEAAKTINWEAAKVINPAAAKTINSEAAKTINPAAAKTINPEAAEALNPAAAKVLDPGRAKILTKTQAWNITPEEARKPVSKN